MSDTSTNTPKPAVCALSSSDGSAIVHYCGVDVPAWMVPKPQPIPKTTLGRLWRDFRAWMRLARDFMSCVFWTFKAVVMRRMSPTSMWIMRESWEAFWLCLRSRIGSLRCRLLSLRVGLRTKLVAFTAAFVKFSGNGVFHLQQLVKRLLHVGIAVLKFLGKFGRNLRHGEPPDVKD